MKFIELMPILIVGFTVVFLSAKGEPGAWDAPPSSTPDPSPKNSTLLEGYQKMEKTFRSLMRQGVKRLLPMITENSSQGNVSQQCIRNLMHLISGFNDIKSWALMFFDASGKMWNGLMKGTVTALGSYDECINIKVNSTRLTDNGKRLFNGQYCFIDIKPPTPAQRKFMAKATYIPEELRNFAQRDTFVASLSKDSNFFKYISLRIGLCTPSGCSKEDITTIVSSFGSQLGLKIVASKCEVKEDDDYTPLIIGIITYFSILALLFISGTLLGTYIYYRKAVFKNKAISILLAFNFITNYKNFQSSSTSSSEITSLNGLRFLTMTWIILNHTYLVCISRILHASKDRYSMIASFFFQIIINGTLQTDLFFVLSGLLLVYVLVIKKNKNPRFQISPLMFTIHRILRIYPCYVLAILSVFLLPLFGSGPVWHETLAQFNGNCYHNVWSNLLFINNFYKPDYMCMYHTWFIAADFQLYMFSLIILLVMFKWPKAGVGLMFLLILICVFFTAIQTYINSYPPVMLGISEDPRGVSDFMSAVYVKPFSHAGPYGVGMLTGYLLATKPDLKFSPRQQVAGWCAAIFLSTSTIYGTWKWNAGVDPTLAESVIYAGFFRTGFCMGVAWMIICCATGHANVINYILSWKIYGPLGRLTFLAYLFHPIILTIYHGNLKVEFQLYHFIVVWLFFGHLCVSYIMAFVGHFLVELPFNNLETMIFAKPRHKDENLKDMNEKNIIKEFSNQEKNGDIPTVTLPTDVESGKL